MHAVCHAKPKSRPWTGRLMLGGIDVNRVISDCGVDQVGIVSTHSEVSALLTSELQFPMRPLNTSILPTFPLPQPDAASSGKPRVQFAHIAVNSQYLEAKLHTFFESQLKVMVNYIRVLCRQHLSACVRPMRLLWSFLAYFSGTNKTPSSNRRPDYRHQTCCCDKKLTFLSSTIVQPSSRGSVESW